jgi:hypothetical protein
VNLACQHPVKSCGKLPVNNYSEKQKFLVMQNQSLFGHLAAKFGEHPENLATESLNYILGQSGVAKKAFCQLLEMAGVRFNGTLHFQTQVNDEDDAIPDLIETATISMNYQRIYNTHDNDSPLWITCVKSLTFYTVKRCDI